MGDDGGDKYIVPFVLVIDELSLTVEQGDEVLPGLGQAQ